jgi:6-phosphogluconolactonase
VSAPANLAYIGTYTRSGRSEGIHVFSHDPDSGKLTLRSGIETVDPSWLTFDPTKRFLFATNEGLTTDLGQVVSYALDPTSGALTELSRQQSGGGEPCHLCVSAEGAFLLCANHENGTVGVFPIDANGRLSEASDVRQHAGSGPGATQQGPHAHHVTFDPTGQRVLVTDKGIDQVVIYRLDRGKLVPSDPPFGRLHAGAAPRHLAFNARGDMAYVNGEADMTLAALAYDPKTGAFQEVQSVSTLPEGASRERASTAEVALSPSGNAAYVSNRGHDTIAVFAIEPASGRLTPRGHVATGGRTPRSFAIDPSGRRLYAANQDSDTIVHFALDPGTGALTPDGQVTSVGAPVCILFT